MCETLLLHRLMAKHVFRAPLPVAPAHSIVTGNRQHCLQSKKNSAPIRFMLLSCCSFRDNCCCSRRLQSVSRSSLDLRVDRVRASTHFRKALQHSDTPRLWAACSSTSLSSSRVGVVCAIASLTATTSPRILRSQPACRKLKLLTIFAAFLLTTKNASQLDGGSAEDQRPAKMCALPAAGARR